MGYGFVDQGILSSKLVQAWTAPSFVIDNMMSRQSLIFTSACLTKKNSPECDEDYPCQGLGEHAHFR